MTKEIRIEKCCGGEEVVVDELQSQRETLDAERLKEIVKERYAGVSKEKSGCGCGCSDDTYDTEFSFVGEAYRGRKGYVEEADLGLGCGVPTELAGLSSGETVLDLGSGAGIDAFIARDAVGPEGEVIGLDFTPEMIRRAAENAEKLGFDNVRFVLGDIESMPIPDAAVDVILSNCVINLVPNKRKAFEEMNRVLRPGGRFAVSDIVMRGHVPDRLRESAALYAGCVTGAIELEEYVGLLEDVGFTEVQVDRERTINIDDDILRLVADPEEIERFNRTGGIASVTMTGRRKP